MSDDKVQLRDARREIRARIKIAREEADGLEALLMELERFGLSDDSNHALWRLLVDTRSRWVGR